MLLIYGNESNEAALPEAERMEMYQAHIAYAQDLVQKGVMLAGDPLLPTSAATTVRARGGKILPTHGPFAETTEQLGGYYIIQCANLDEAIEWAAKNPSAATGAIEVRPIMEV
jgi:hypothetical protein